MDNIYIISNLQGKPLLTQGGLREGVFFSIGDTNYSFDEGVLYFETDREIALDICCSMTTQYYHCIVIQLNEFLIQSLSDYIEGQYKS